MFAADTKVLARGGGGRWWGWGWWWWWCGCGWGGGGGGADRVFDTHVCPYAPTRVQLI